MNDPLFVRALVLRSETASAVLVTIDAVSLGGIGRIPDTFLERVRERLRAELEIPPEGVLINASHCHGIVCADVEDRTVQAVRAAAAALVPVRVGAGSGREDRISENRRLRLTDGREADVRRAYALPPDELVAAVGPIDPEIGLLRIDRADGTPLAVVYVFACHPILGVVGGGNTADFPGFASAAIEGALGSGTAALFVQGCAGDVNPVGYKDPHRPRDARPLGDRLALSVLEARNAIPTAPAAELRTRRDVLALPRAADYDARIARIEAEQHQRLGDLKGTALNFKEYLALLVRHELGGAFPATDAHRYLHEKTLGRDDLARQDADDRANLDAYAANVRVMEELTRLQENLTLLRRHRDEQAAAASPTLSAELVGLRVGPFRLVAFPGELSVEIGLRIKKAAPNPFTFVAGYTNGYLFYAPTEAQRGNPGFAQEDCDCLLAPAWQRLFEEHVGAMLESL